MPDGPPTTLQSPSALSERLALFPFEFVFTSQISFMFLCVAVLEYINARLLEFDSPDQISFSAASFLSCTTVLHSFLPITSCHSRSTAWCVPKRNSFPKLTQFVLNSAHPFRSFPQRSEIRFTLRHRVTSSSNLNWICSFWFQFHFYQT